MKHLKKIVALTLAAFTAVSFAACSNAATVPTPDNTVHTVEGTLHKVNVTERNVPFVVNGNTDYKIYVDVSNPKFSSAINRSATFVGEQIFAATGGWLSIETELPADFSAQTRAIVYGFQDEYSAMGLTVPTEDIASSGYYIKTKGNAVFIEANGADGYRMAGLAFLRAVIGYDMISEDCIIYDKDGKTMPEIEIVERPDFDYRQISNYYTSTEVYGMGMHTHTDIWIPVNGWDMHNSLYFIPPTEFAEEHPEWYRSDQLQPCYTAHGVKEEYDAMQQQVFEVIKQRMQECPTLENISFTAMDGTGQDSCWCDTCLEYKELYGTPAAACIYFMNDLNKLVQNYIAEEDPGRVMNLIFFAYHDSEPAPVERVKRTDANGNVIWGSPIKNENGEYGLLKRYARDEEGKFIQDANGNYQYETDENGNYVYLTCDEHVYPWLAPIYSKFTASFYDERNASYAENVALWYTVSSNVYVWIYGTNFKYYLFPYNNWSVMTETYRYLKECGVKYVWDQGQERNQATAFTDLKDYIDSKFLFDVNADYAEVINRYFKYYYKDAEEPMRKLFHLIQARSAYLEQTVPTISGGIYDEIGEAGYWPQNTVETMLALIDEAYKAVEKYKTTDVALYNGLVKHVKQESIFPRYVQCKFYGDKYENIRELRLQFRDDWNELGFSIFKEADGDMQSVFTQEWGL